MNRTKNDLATKKTATGSLKTETAEFRLAVGHRIAAARRRAGLSQEELAAALGIRDWSVSRYETGRSIPRVVRLIAICKLLGTTADYLYGLAPELTETAASKGKETLP